MQNYLAFIGILIFFSLLIGRATMMRKKGIKAIVFGATDKSDFFLLPVFAFFFYQVAAVTFNLPLLFGEKTNQFFYIQSTLRWAGVVVCFIGLLGFYLSLRAFGDSFRVGIDDKNPDKLVTTGIFAISRNPIYVSFAFFFLGIFLVMPTLIFMLIFLFAVLLFHRQVLREEKFLKSYYGKDYVRYCQRVPRYL